MKVKNLLMLFIALFAVACEKEDITDDGQNPKILEYDFSSSAEDWTGGFADYPEGAEDFYELSFLHANLPAPLNENHGALKQSGNNHSDDLFMFITKKITGLTPGINYEVDFEIEFATNASDGSVGVGGSPGSSVYVKAGIMNVEPKPEKQSDGYFRMNIDKANQSNSGKDMKLLGDFSNGTNQNIYALKVLKSDEGLLKARTNDNGELWLIIGTDSGFEATTTIYYNKIKAELTAGN